MAAMPIESDDAARFDPQVSLDEVKLRLVEAVGNLMRPLPTAADLAERVHAVAAELERIQADLLLVYHVAQSEEKGLRTELDTIDQRLAEGWVPEGKPLDDVLARLQPLVHTSSD